MKTFSRVLSLLLTVTVLSSCQAEDLGFDPTSHQPDPGYPGPGGELTPLPEIDPGNFEAVLTPEQQEAIFEEIDDELEEARENLPEDPAARAQALVTRFSNLPGIRFVEASSTNETVTVQLADGTPMVIFTQGNPTTDEAVSPPAPVFSLMSSQGVSSDFSASTRGSQSASLVTTAGGPGSGDKEELPKSSKVVLIKILNLGKGATSNIKQAFDKKGYTPSVLNGTLADFRTKVKGVDVLWITTHGGYARLPMSSGPNPKYTEFLALGTGEQVVNPCAASPDCAVNRADIAKLRLLRTAYAEGGPQFWAITRNFITHYWKLNSQSIAYIDGCTTGAAAPYAQALRADLKSVGAGAILGWDGITSVGGSAQASSIFFDTVLGANLYLAPTPKQRPFSADRVYEWMKKTGRTMDSLNGVHLVYERKAPVPTILAPSIEFMTVWEENQQLELYGEFGSKPGTVEINGTSVPVASWSHHSIKVDIPDSAEGEVVVIVDKHESNATPLASWSGTMKQVLTTTAEGPPGITFEVNCSKLHFRGDAHAHRTEPGALPVRGQGGIVYLMDATRDSNCTWAVSGHGLEDDYKTYPIGTKKGTLPWYANNNSPSEPPWWFWTGKIRTYGISPIEKADVKFILNYMVLYKIRIEDLQSGSTFDTDMFPMFNAGGVTLNTWYPLDTNLNFPSKTLQITIPGMSDQGQLTQDIQANLHETPDTES